MGLTVEWTGPLSAVFLAVADDFEDVIGPSAVSHRFLFAAQSSESFELEMEFAVFS